MRIDFLRIPAILACFFSALMVPQVWAADIVVDTTLDSQAADGLCSLREAILNAEGADQSGSVDCTAGSSVANRILFEPFLIGSSIALTGGVLPAISRNIEIIGPVVGDPEGLEINAGGSSRIFEISQADAVRLVDLKLIKGQTATPGQPGATIWIDNGSNVGLERVWIEGSAALEAGGGAIALFDSTLTIEFSFLEQNGAAGAGGAVFASNSNVQIDDSNFENNSAVGTGGGISLVGGQLTVNNSDFTLNSTRGNNGSGGALSVEGADLFLNHSQIAHNFTEGQSAQGGGVHVFNGNLHMSGGSVQNNVGQGEFASGGGVRVRDGSAFFSDGCEIRDNLTSQLSGYGGGVRVSGGHLTMNNCVVSGNRTLGDNAHGGGIYVIDGKATIENSQITDNSTEGVGADGGGLRILNGDLEMIKSLVENNATKGNTSGGAGVYSLNSDVIILGSIIQGNEVESGVGGGLRLQASTLSIESTLISGNHASGTAGGLSIRESSGEIKNTTISSNTNGMGGGTAMYVSRSFIDLIHSTIALNSSGSGGSELFVFGVADEPAELRVINSLLAVESLCLPCSVAGTCVHAHIVDIGSIATNAGCGPEPMPLSLINLDSLADNGGPTSTHALLPGSLAINAAGDCTADLNVTLDQRGKPRPGGASMTCDVGAFEFQGASPVADLAVTIDVSPDPVEVDGEITITVELSNLGPDPASNIEVQIEWPNDWAGPRGHAMAGPDRTVTWLWDVPFLAPSSTEEFTMRVYPTQPGVDEASVNVSALQHDPNAANDSAVDTIEITLPDSIFHDRFRNMTPRTP